MSKLDEILQKLYETAVQDADGVRAGRKGYRMRYDEVPEMYAKEILAWVEQDIIGEDESIKHAGNSPQLNSIMGQNMLRAEQRKKLRA